MPHSAWRHAISALRDGVALLDGDGVVVSCNPAFRRLTGLGPDEPPERALQALAPLEPGVVRELERGGRWVEVRVELAGDGLVVVLADVTGRRRTAEELRVSNHLLGALFEASPIAILAVDLDMRVTIWNPASERLFGWPRDEILGQTYLVAVPDAGRARFQHLFDEVIAGRGFTGVEVERRRRDGSLVQVRVSTAPVRDGEGRVVGAMALLDDLTDRLRLEERVRQIERMEAIGRLAGGIAHDFNNLLTIVLGATERLESARASERDRLLQDVRRAAERASELTRHLLAYSRRQVLQPARIDVSEAVRDAASVIRRLIGEDIEVALDLCPTVLPVVADRTQLQRVVMNLAINARDAMPSGGRLSLATRMVPEDERPPVLAAEGDRPFVELAVSDTGGGVAPDVLPHIFEPFFTTKAPGEGTGLGLAMVYGVVRQSGGEVVVENGRRGATFRVLLPLDAGPLDAPEVRDTPTAGPRRLGATVLLVEDDDEVRSTLDDLLRALGYRVIVARGGVEALQVADAHDGPIHVMLTDVVMPGMTGREVAEALVAWRPTTRVLFMSGYTDDAVLRTGLATAGPTASFLQKPFTASALDARLRALIGG